MTTTKLFTADDLWQRQQTDDQPYELVDGELISMSPTAGEHGGLMASFSRHLGNHVVPNRLGRVFAGDVGFIIGRNPDTVLAPDVAFVRADRLPPDQQQKRFMPLVPDLVVEIVSPSNSPHEIEEKVRRYHEASVPLVWLAYVDERRVVVRERGEAPRAVGVGEILDGASVLPGLRLAIADLFQG